MGAAKACCDGCSVVRASALMLGRLTPHTSQTSHKTATAITAVGDARPPRLVLHHPRKLVRCTLLADESARVSLRLHRPARAAHLLILLKSHRARLGGLI
jgi:hypothetical protein